MEYNKKVELYLQKLNLLNSKALNLIISDSLFTNKINNNFDEIVEATSALLSRINKSERLSYFCANINAFAKADEAVILFDELSSVFSIAPEQILECVIDILNCNINTENYTKNIFTMIENSFLISREEAIRIIEKHPKFLGCNMKKYYNNIFAISQKYKVKKATLTHIFKNSPLFFAKNDLISSVYMISKMLSLSALELDYLLYTSYPLLLSPMLTLRENITTLINVFQLDDSDVISLIKTRPEILLIPKSSLYNFSKIVMRAFSYPESSLGKMICACPKLLTFPQGKLLNHSRKLLDFDIFVKKDLKEIMDVSPEILLSPTKSVACQILNLSRILSLTTSKSITNTIRVCPKILSILNLEEKIKKLNSYLIPTDYTKIAPNILTCPSVLLAIKFSILAPFNLEYELDSVIDQPIKLILSRLQYLSSHSASLHDITLSSELFEAKYKISSIDLLQQYPITTDSFIDIINLAQKKYSGNDKHFNMLKNFITADYLYEIKLYLSHSATKDMSPKTNKQQIKKMLLLLGIDHDDAMNIANLLFNTILSSNVFAVIHQLSSFGFSRDEIIQIILRKPIILASSVKRLKEKYNDLKNEYSNENLILANII